MAGGREFVCFLARLGCGEVAGGLRYPLPGDARTYDGGRDVDAGKNYCPAYATRGRECFEVTDRVLFDEVVDNVERLLTMSEQSSPSGCGDLPGSSGLRLIIQECT